MPGRQARFGGAAALAVASGVLHGACYPPYGLWPLGFVALAPLVVAVHGAGWRRALALGWLHGTVMASLVVVPWITEATRTYFTQGPVGAVAFASLVGQVFQALPCAVFAVAAARIAATWAAPIATLGLAGAWVGLELLRSRALTGAPWALLGHVLYQHPLWLQTADFGGAFTISFVLASTGGAAALWWIRGGVRHAVGAVAVAGLVVAGSVAYGAWRLGADWDAGPVLRIALVQGNVPNAWRGDPRRGADALRAFVTATRPILADAPELIVWSENAVSFLVEPSERFRDAVRALLGPDGPSLLVGAPRYEQAGAGVVRFFNSAFLLDGEGRTLAVYDKRRLVPFAEYAPLVRVPWFGWRFDAPDDYSPGRAATVFERPAPFGVLICYEAIYPALARDLVDGGAELLINVSNDAWFGTTVGLEQHFATTMLRSVELRRTLVRGTNTGITAVVDPAGRILHRYPAHVAGAWTSDVPRRRDRTVYGRVGDVFAAAVGLLGAGLALGAGRETGGGPT